MVTDIGPLLEKFQQVNPNFDPTPLTLEHGTRSLLEAICSIGPADTGTVTTAEGHNITGMVNFSTYVDLRILEPIFSYACDCTLCEPLGSLCHIGCSVIK